MIFSNYVTDDVTDEPSIVYVLTINENFLFCMKCQNLKRVVKVKVPFKIMADSILKYFYTFSVLCQVVCCCLTTALSVKFQNSNL